MNATNKRLRLPFVITVGVTTAAACGGTVTVFEDGESGSGGSGGSTSTLSSGHGGTSTTNATSTTNTTTSTNPPPPCPTELPNGYNGCEPLYEGSVCDYDVSCQSGTVNLSFACTGGFWEIVSKPCDWPYDSCPGTELYCNGEWWMPMGTNPPSPCDPTIPAGGTSCFPGGMGGDWEHCGYSCGPDPATDGWIVASCVQLEPDGPYSWQHDKSCPE